MSCLTLTLCQFRTVFPFITLRKAPKAVAVSDIYDPNVCMWVCMCMHFCICKYSVTPSVRSASFKLTAHLTCMSDGCSYLFT